MSTVRDGVEDGGLVVRLEPGQLEVLADLVAERLAERSAGELISAADLAGRIGWSRETVYAHAAALGAMRLGDGPRPRLMFRWPQVLDALTACSATVRSEPTTSPASTGTPGGQGRRRRRSLGNDVELLPVRGLEGKR